MISRPVSALTGLIARVAFVGIMSNLFVGDASSGYAQCRLLNKYLDSSSAPSATLPDLEYSRIEQLGNRLILQSPINTYASDNAGATWSVLGQLKSVSATYGPFDGTYLFVRPCEQANTCWAVISSSDGVNWKTITIPKALSSSNAGPPTVASSKTNWVAADPSGCCLAISVDDGQTWAAMPVPGDFHTPAGAGMNQWTTQITATASAGRILLIVSPVYALQPGEAPRSFVYRMSDGQNPTWDDITPCQCYLKQNAGANMGGHYQDGADAMFVSDAEFAGIANDPQTAIKLATTLDGGDTWSFSPPPSSGISLFSPLSALGARVVLWLADNIGHHDPYWYMVSTLDQGRTWRPSGPIPKTSSMLGSAGDSAFFSSKKTGLYQCKLR